jgi:hypothetical protein
MRDAKTAELKRQIGQVRISVGSSSSSLVFIILNGTC